MVEGVWMSHEGQLGLCFRHHRPMSQGCGARSLQREQRWCPELRPWTCMAGRCRCDSWAHGGRAGGTLPGASTSATTYTMVLARGDRAPELSFMLLSREGVSFHQVQVLVPILILYKVRKSYNAVSVRHSEVDKEPPLHGRGMLR